MLEKNRVVNRDRSAAHQGALFAELQCCPWLISSCKNSSTGK